jgi:hypothetical protein
MISTSDSITVYEDISPATIQLDMSHRRQIMVACKAYLEQQTQRGPQLELTKRANSLNEE